MANTIHHVARYLQQRGQRIVRRLTCRRRVLPDFVIIGAQKCGTTSLYAYLNRHPQVVPAYEKEIGYFSRHYARGVNWYKSMFPTAESLARLKAEIRLAPITGEATPGYLCSPGTPALIKQCLPNVRLLAILRDPVDRAVSHFFHSRRLKYEPLADMSAALALEEDRIRSSAAFDASNTTLSRDYFMYGYKRRGVYHEQLARWFDVFPKEQFLVLCLEDLQARPQELLDETCDFLRIQRHIFRGLRRHNVGQRKDVGESILTELREYYRPHNERLFEMIGKRFPWS